MKNWTKTILSAAFAAICGILLSAGAHAQDLGTFVTSPPPCVIVADVVVLDDGSAFTSAGTMGLATIGSSPITDAFQWQTFAGVSFNATTEDPELGTIVWASDNSKPIPISTIRSNQRCDLFPATVDLFFNVRATISSQPGVTFVSEAPVQMRNTNMLSFGPCNNERLTAVGPITFLREDNGEVAFKVTTLTSTLD